MAADALGTPAPAATPTVGVVSDEDHRIALAGIIATQTSSLAVRTGVMWGPGTSTLISGTSATGTMTYSIAIHHAVTTRGTADGIYMGPNLDAVVTVPTTAAPGSNSRIDIIYVKQNDTASTISADTGSTAPIYAVANGTAAVSPVAPSLPVGAIELGRATVAAGATSTNGAGVTISQTAVQTVARGADIPVRNQAERDALTTYPLLAVKRLDTGNIEMRNAANSAWVTVFDAAAVSPWTAYTPTWTAANSAPAVGNGTLSGRYRQNGKSIEISITLTIGSTTNGGTGAWSFTLPVASVASREQVLLCKAFTASGLNWSGFGLLPGGSTIAPHLPMSSSVSSTAQVQNANSGAAVGTGVPAISGAFTFGAGNNLVLSGVYEAA